MNIARPITKLEFREAREDEIAAFLEAMARVRRLHTLNGILLKRNFIDADYHKEMRETLDYIDEMLMTGKHNTARLRNREA